jgi:hypothetical protein
MFDVWIWLPLDNLFNSEIRRPNYNSVKVRLGHDFFASISLDHEQKSAPLIIRHAALL